jgi:hypothetical protein
LIDWPNWSINLSINSICLPPYARNVLSGHKTQSGVLRSLRGKSGKYSQLHRFLNGVQLRFKLIVAIGDPAGVSRKS